MRPDRVQFDDDVGRVLVDAPQPRFRQAQRTLGPLLAQSVVEDEPECHRRQRTDRQRRNHRGGDRRRDRRSRQGDDRRQRQHVDQRAEAQELGPAIRNRLGCTPAPQCEPGECGHRDDQEPGHDPRPAELDPRDADDQRGDGGGQGTEVEPGDGEQCRTQVELDPRDDRPAGEHQRAADEPDQEADGRPAPAAVADARVGKVERESDGEQQRGGVEQVEERKAVHAELAPSPGAPCPAHGGNPRRPEGACTGYRQRGH